MHVFSTENITDMGFNTMTDIQTKFIPDPLEGHNLVGRKLHLGKYKLF